MTIIAPQVNLGDIVKVINHGPRPLKLMWDSRKYVIAPDAEEFVPFECAKLYFGDPRALENVQSVRDDRGVVGFVSDRATEVRRLRLLWDHSFGEYIPGEVDAFDTARIPHVDVFTVRGERVPMVLDDPEGNAIIPAQQTRTEQTDMRAQLAQQGSLINALMERLGMQPGSTASANLPPIEPFPEPTLQHPPSPGQPRTPAKMMYDPKDGMVKEEPDAIPEDPDDLESIPEVEE